MGAENTRPLGVTAAQTAVVYDEDVAAAVADAGNTPGERAAEKQKEDQDLAPPE